MRKAFFISISTIIILSVIGIASLLYLPKVQKWTYSKWVEPVLATYGISTNFAAFHYGNKGLQIDQLSLFLNDSAVCAINGLNVSDIGLEDGQWRIGSLVADSIFLNARDTAHIKQWFTQLPESEGAQASSLMIEVIEWPKTAIAVDDDRSVRLGLVAQAVQITPALSASAVQLDLRLDSLEAKASITDLTLVPNAPMHLDLSTNFGAALGGDVTWTEDGVHAAVSGMLLPSLQQWGLDSLTTELLTGARFTITLISDGLEYQADYTTANEFFELNGRMEATGSGYHAKGLFKVTKELNTLIGLSESATVLSELEPELVYYELTSEDFSDVNFTVNVLAKENQIKVHAPSLHQVAKIELNAPDLAVGPVLGGTVKAALKPNLRSLIDDVPFEVVGLAPRLRFKDHEVRGFSFDYHHGPKDSIWWSCLDTLMDLSGHITMVEDVFKGNAEIHALGLMLLDPLDTGQVISGDLAFNVNNELEGSAEMKNVLLQRPTDVVFINSFNISHQYSSAERSVQVNSEVLSGSLEGRFQFEDLLPIGEIIVSDLIGQSHHQSLKTTSLNLNADIGSVNWLSQLLHLDLSIPEGGSISGGYRGIDNSWELQAYVPSIGIGGQKIEQLRMQTTATNHLINGTLSISEGQFPGIDLAQSSIAWKPTDKQRAQVHLVRKDSLQGSLDATVLYENLSYDITRGRVLLGEDSIVIINGGPIYWNGKTIVFDTIALGGTQGRMNLGGVLGGQPGQSLWLTWQDGDASLLNYFYRDPNLSLSGPVAVQLEVPSLATGFDLRGFMQSPVLRVNGWNYGDWNLAARWDGVKRDLFLNGYLKQGVADARINGHYDAYGDDLDFTLSTNALAIEPFQTYLDDVLEPIQGKLSGGVQLYGPLSDWRLNGEFSLEKASFGIPIIGGQLASPKGIDFSVNEQRILLDTSYWKDEEYGTEAMLWGSIPHHRFQDLAFDLKLSTDSLYAMQLERQYDSYFYGTGIAGGTMDLEGPLEQLHLGLDLATKSGTSIKIPLDNPTAVETPSFIQFVENSVVPKGTGTARSYEYFTTDIAVEVTPDAQVELILDEVLGDIIKARGEGAMQMKILEDESFELYGLYTVESGDYLFTLQGIINKQFELLPGGTILWSGDLYEAELNLQAKYSLSTSLNGLVTNPNYNNANVDVDLIVELTGPLLAPTIGFSIELPNSPSSYQQELERRILTADAMNYQAFSLLMLGDFYRQNLAVQEGINLGESLSRSTSEMLVSQFGSWITAGLGTYVDVELDYTSGNNPYNTLINSGDEIRLGVSKDFLDGRLRINSSVDVPLAQDGSSTLLLGDTQIEYALTKDGRTVLKAFNRSNRNDPLLQSSGPYTQGVGIQFRKDFDTLKKD